MTPREGPWGVKIDACGNHGFVCSARKILWLRWPGSHEVTRRTYEIFYRPWDASLCYRLYPFMPFFCRNAGSNREIMRQIANLTALFPAGCQWTQLHALTRSPISQVNFEAELRLSETLSVSFVKLRIVSAVALLPVSARCKRRSQRRCAD